MKTPDETLVLNHIAQRSHSREAHNIIDYPAVVRRLQAYFGWKYVSLGDSFVLDVTNHQLLWVHQPEANGTTMQWARSSCK